MELEAAAIQLRSFSQVKQTKEGTSIVNIPGRLIGCRRRTITLVRENLARSELRKITPFHGRYCTYSRPEKMRVGNDGA